MDGKPLKIRDQSYADGIGTHADSSFSLVLDGKAESLTAEVGVDAEVGANGSVEFVERKELFGGKLVRPLSKCGGCEADQFRKGWSRVSDRRHRSAQLKSVNMVRERLVAFRLRIKMLQP